MKALGLIGQLLLAAFALHWSRTGWNPSLRWFGFDVDQQVGAEWWVDVVMLAIGLCLLLWLAVEAVVFGVRMALAEDANDGD